MKCKLYEVPAGAKVKIAEPGYESDIVYKFFNLDGMYSYCTDSQGNVEHLAAWTEVEIVNENL